MRDIELALGTTVAAELPYDPLAYLNAANEGIPVVVGAPKSAAAMRLVNLADSVFGAPVGEAPATVAPTRRLGFLRRSERRGG